MSTGPVVLVTGGCGYIGSHVVRDLMKSGYTPVIVDNLSTGRKESVPDKVTFYQGDCGDKALIRRIHNETKFESVLHFAASIIVSESVEAPLKYYQNNVSNTLNLIEALCSLGVSSFVLSSSAAVYGEQSETLISEEATTRPIHPYGRSKLMDEWILQDAAKAYPMRFLILRYFNVAGADPQFRTGQCSPVATHLIKIGAEAAVGKRSSVSVFGNDYNTPDGTCVRDYVHVSDLSSAHVAGLKYIHSGGESCILNCGYSRGYSVREVIDVVLQHADKPFNVVSGPRRGGDVGSLIANAQKIGQVLGWKPEHNSLDKIVSSSVQWEQRLKDSEGKWPGSETDH